MIIILIAVFELLVGFIFFTSVHISSEKTVLKIVLSDFTYK